MSNVDVTGGRPFFGESINIPDRHNRIARYEGMGNSEVAIGEWRFQGQSVILTLTDRQTDRETDREGYGFIIL
jgi:hypothetical protein